MKCICHKTALPILLLIVAALTQTCTAKENSYDEGPNVILISIDTLRADRVGCYGYGRNTTPNIDKFAEKAALFTTAITPRPKTTPSLVSILTGLYPHTHGVRTLYAKLSRDIPTLQKILKKNNYRTAAFVGNWVLKKKYSGLNQGFDLYNDSLRQSELNRPIYEKIAPSLTESVLSWLKDADEKKFFLWVHYQDPHGPYTAPEEYRNRFKHDQKDLVDSRAVPPYQILPWVKAERGQIDLNAYRDAYDAEIRFCDSHLGDLLEYLEQPNGRESIIIITADHGESLGDHDYYFEHGDYVYDACSRVPLLIRAPRLVLPQRIDDLVNVMGITPTILDLLEMRIPDSIEAGSLKNLMDGNPLGSPADPVFIENRNLIKAVRTQNWKYISNVSTGTEELYDLEMDPGETKNLVLEQMGKAEDLKQLLSSWLNESDLLDIQELNGKNLKRTDVERLKALGYIK